MSSQHARPRAQTVLVVDDDVGVRLIVARMLEDEACAVRIAPSAAAALLILSTDPAEIDFVLTDVRMPGMSGLDLALELRRGWPEIPVGLMSAHQPEELRSTHRDLAGLPFLPKPFSPPALVAFIETLAAQVRDAPADAAEPA